jgi:hypothetical protein
MLGIGGAGQTSKALTTGFDWTTAANIASGVNEAVNSKDTGSKFMGLLGTLSGIGMGQSKKDSDTISDKGMKDMKGKLGSEVMKIAHHRNKGLPKLKGWQHRNLKRHNLQQIPEAPWYGGIG